MFRLLFTALLGTILLGLVRMLGIARRLHSTVKPATPVTGNRPAEMIACAHCGTFILKSETISSLGQSYCSERCEKGTS